MRTLANYMIEIPRPTGGWMDLQATTDRIRRAAVDLRREGRRVRFLRAVFVPEDDTCFFVIEGPSRPAVREVVARAALTAGRIEQAFTAPAGQREDAR